MRLVKRLVVAAAGLAMVSLPGAVPAAVVVVPATPVHQQALVCDGLLYDKLKAVEVVCDGFQPVGGL